MNKIPRIIRWTVSTAILFLLLMSILRLVTYSVFHVASAHDEKLSRVFWYGFRYDARYVGILCLSLLILGSFKWLNPFTTRAGKTIAQLLLFVFTVGLAIFYTFDFFHYHYLQQRLNASALSFLEDTAISAGMVWQSYPVIKILLALVVTIVVLYWLVKKIYKYYAKQPAVTGKAPRIAGFIVVFFVFAVAIFGRVGQYPLRWSDSYKLGSDFNANLALNPMQSFFSSLRFRNSTYNLAKVKQYYPFMAKYLGVDRPDSARLNFERYFPANDSVSSTSPNVILVICESFSGYKSSMWGNPLNTTPFFQSLCDKGVFFDNCFTPQFGTARGVWATVTGMPDVEMVKTASRNPAMVDQHTIINDFKGYEKFYFLGGSSSWANVRGLLINNIEGLNLYEEGSYDVPRVDVWGISDKNLFLEANKVLSKQTKPFFAIIQTADNHRPYTIPAEDLKEFSRQTVPIDTLKKYGFVSLDEYNAFRYTDYCYRKFMEAAEQSPYFKNTVFAFIGDHGITGSAGDMFPRPWSDNMLASFHVPLLFYSPGKLAPQRIHSIASQVDVLPTLAGISNISYHNYTLGRDLLRQQTIDSGRNNIGFIMDHNNFDIGVLKGPWYYERNQKGNKENLVWFDFNEAQNQQKTPALEEEYRFLTNAYFETIRYMLLNNKKRNGN